jgi:tellurite resistance protein TerC
LACAFNVVIYFAYENHWLGIGGDVGFDVGGRKAATQFATGFVVEKSLSIDNIFVIALIFNYFRVPSSYQHRVLFWGILGALIMRGAMIGAGTALIRRFDWTIYLFGALLLYTAVRLSVSEEDKIDPEDSALVRISRRLFRVSESLDGTRFFTRVDGKPALTPLFLVLLAVESADVLFAVDSIPAIFAITLDPFIVYTSNIFAILGLRSLYFTLAAAIDKFRHLKSSLVFMLAFIGIKMILAHHYPIPAWVSLTVIGSILAVGIATSIWSTRLEERAARRRQGRRDRTGESDENGWTLGNE